MILQPSSQLFFPPGGAQVLGGAGGGAFTPESIVTGLDFSLRVSREFATGNLLKDAYPVDTVTESQGMTLVQATSTKQPRIYGGANGINSKPVIQADGSDLLRSASILSGAKGAIFAIFRPTTVPQTSGATLFSSSDEATATKYLRLSTHFSTDTVAIIQVNADTFDIQKATTTTLIQDAVYCLLLMSSGTAYSARINGVAQTITSGGGANSGDWFDDTPDRDNTVLFQLKNTGETAQFKGALAELVIWNDIDLSASDITNLENYAVSAYGVQLSANQISLTTPKPYTTKQRNGSNQASVTIAGKYSGSPTAIEYRWRGGAWATLDAAPAAGAYTGAVTLTGSANAAQGDLEVRFSNVTTVTATAKYIGVGDVLACGGQSNMSGRGTNYQTYSAVSGQIPTLYGNDDRYKDCLDPTDALWGEVGTVSGDSPLSGGSFLPLLGTLLMTQTGFPVCFVPGARGGLAISSWNPGADHSDRGTLYGNLKVRAEATGATLVIMWEGESDVIAGTAEATFNTAVDTISNAFATDVTGAPQTMWAHIQDLSSYLTGYSNTAVNAAITTAEGDNANVAVGPTFVDLAASGANGGDEIHFGVDSVNGNTELATVASRWSVAIIAAMGW